MLINNSQIFHKKNQNYYHAILYLERQLTYYLCLCAIVCIKANTKNLSGNAKSPAT